jgi:hypothetical protein
MKGTLTKNSEGVWMVKWSDLHSFAHGTHWMYTELIPDNQNPYKGLIDDSQNEGLEVEFEMVAGYDNNGPEHFPKYARIITPEEAELKDWDVTLNDGLENEPYVSDDFQIGPDGAYEHTEEWNTLPREKASELIVNYQTAVASLDYNEAKQCSLIMVNEIKRILYDQDLMIRYDYWFEVKKEIEKL